MIDILRSTWPLFLGIALLMLGNGLQGTLVSWRANNEGFEPSTIGWIMTAYYFGFLIGSLYTTRLIQQVGHTRVFAVLASLASTAVLVKILFISPDVWLVMRLISGFCTLLLIYFIFQNEAVLMEDQVDYQLAPSKPTIIAMEAIAEEAEETMLTDDE